MGNQSDYSVERLADRMQIQDCMYRWCRGVDRLDFESIRSAFHDDAIDRHGVYEGGVDGLVEWIRERHRAIPFSMHLVANMLIEFADRDTAIAETYCLAVQRYPSEDSRRVHQRRRARAWTCWRAPATSTASSGAKANGGLHFARWCSIRPCCTRFRPIRRRPVETWRWGAETGRIRSTSSGPRTRSDRDSAARRDRQFMR